MKRQHVFVKIIATLSASFLAIILASSLRAQSTNPQHPMTKNELKWLIQHANSAADHQKLAAYYRSQADHLMQESKEHHELAEAYANGTTFAPKSGFPGGLLRHCQELAALEAKAANQAQQMAAIHEEMAKKSSN
jgi:hypothetical protein